MSTTTEPSKVETFVDDSVIITKIKAKYLVDDLVNVTDINVQCEKGYVTLNGTVNSQSAFDQAKAIAEAISGVVSVTANLQITEDANY